MFEDVTKDYTGVSALFEVLIIIAISFILGYLLHYLLTKRKYEQETLMNTHDDDRKKLPEKTDVSFANEVPDLESIPEQEPQHQYEEQKIPATVLKPLLDTGRMMASLGKIYKSDDLKLVEGIGPAIEKHLKHAGIETWADLAEADVDRLKNILEDAGPNYRIHNPKTWPDQASLANEGKWDELKEYQNFLSGGV